jgi:hypothetical protein
MNTISKTLRALKFLMIGLVLLAFCLVAIFYWDCSLRPKLIRHDIIKDDGDSKFLLYKRLIQKEIPNGSSIKKVENFLTSYKLYHTDYAIIKNNEEAGYYPLKELAFPNKDQIIKGHIYGATRNIKHSCLVSCDIEMNFYFDKNNQLVTHTTEWGCTGP